jgi:hypothetical protein
MDDDDDEPCTFGHQPHALLSRPDLAAKHKAAGFPADIGGNHESHDPGK